VADKAAKRCQLKTDTKTTARTSANKADIEMQVALVINSENVRYMACDCAEFPSLATPSQHTQLYCGEINQKVRVVLARSTPEAGDEAAKIAKQTKGNNR